MSVKQYIEKAFDKCQSDAERSSMQQYLKQTIDEAKRKNEYSSRDWSLQSLPKLPRETQLKSSLTSNTPAFIKMPISITPASSKSKISTLPKAPLPPLVPFIKLTQKMMSLYDVVRDKQITSINVNVKKKPVMYNMDYVLLQPNQEKRSNNTTQIIKAHQQQSMSMRKIEQEDEENLDWKIIGCCKDLEKPYYRLTGLPDPSSIRPESVLKKSLEYMLNKWKQGEVEYEYIIEQFRSIRQDLMVQHIQNSFSVLVYEENARISLECGDFHRYEHMQIYTRYETCWTMLCDLYEIVQPMAGKSQVANKIEFDSYRIVYLTMLGGKQEQLVKIMNQQDLNIDDQIKTALEQQNTYKIEYDPPIQQVCSDTMESLLGQFLLRIRVKALGQFMRSFVGTLEVSYVAEVLAFQSSQHLISFLDYFESCKLDKGKTSILIKDSMIAFDIVDFDKIND